MLGFGKKKPEPVPIHVVFKQGKKGKWTWQCYVGHDGRGNMSMMPGFKTLEEAHDDWIEQYRLIPCMHPQYLSSEVIAYASEE